MPVEYHDPPRTTTETLSEPLSLGPLSSSPAGSAGGNRILAGTVATLSVTFSVDGTPTDPVPATATVEIIRNDETILVAAGTATTHGTAGVFSYTLTAAETANLDILTLHWTSSLGTITTRVEIVGGFLFTIAEARTVLNNPVYDVGKIREARTYAETELERALGYALVPRYARDTLIVDRSNQIRLSPFVRAVRAASVGGTPLSAANIDNLLLSDDGFVTGYSWWNGRVVVDYEHGLDVDNSRSPGANRSALSLAVEYLGGDASGNGIDPRAERLITDDGTIVYGASAAGQFSVPAVNQWVHANRLLLIA